MKKQKIITNQVNAVVKRFFYKVFPIYFRFWPSWIWLVAWSAPFEPAKWYQYFRALRITVRYGKYHSKILVIIKKGKFDA